MIPRASFYYGWANLALAARHGGDAAAPSRPRIDRLLFAEINLVATLVGSLFCLGIGRLIDRVASLALVGKWFARRLSLAMGVYAIVMSIGFMTAFRGGSIAARPVRGMDRLVRDRLLRPRGGGGRSRVGVGRNADAIIRGPDDVNIFYKETRSMRMLPTLAFGLIAVAVGARAAELNVGDTAPDFKLQASDGKTYKLADFKGKQAVVVAWFPRAFTQGCTIECKSLAANGDKIRKYDVAYFMASVDPVEGEKGNKAFAESEKADFPLLSDPTKEVAAVYGVLNERGVSSRWTFYIDKDGKVAAIDKAVKPATSAEDMIAKLAELKVPTR